MSEQLQFAEVTPVVRELTTGKFRSKGSGKPPANATTEVATVEKAYGAGWLGEFGDREYPNQSTIVNNRSNGQGLRIYRLMMLTDADLSGLFDLLFDDVLHNPAVWRAASKDPAHLEHARFADVAFDRIPHIQNALRHMLLSYAYGFTVLEKQYEVIEQGEFAGAKVWSQLRDKPSDWFTFGPARELRLRTMRNQSPGEPLDPRKFIVTTFGTNSDPFGDPILDYCYWPWRLRHHAFRGHATYMDKWASPTVQVEFDPSADPGVNKENLRKAIIVAQSAQADNVAAFPKGMKMELMESSRNGSVSWELYQDHLWQILSRRITGQILTGSGDKGGSYALGRVHAEAKANKVEMLARFLDSWVSREARELIDMNFGPQEAYPIRKTLATDPSFKQAFLNLEQAALANGHQISKSWSDEVLELVLPDGPDDALQASTTVKPGQILPVSPNLAGKAAPIDTTAVHLAARTKHAAVHADAAARAAKMRDELHGVAQDAKTKARPAIKKVIRSIGARIRTKKTAQSVTKAYLLKGLKGYDSSGLGGVFDTMIRKSPRVHMAGSDKDASDASKIAMALLIYSITESISRQAADAPEDMSASDFADSLLDENAASGSVFTVQAGMFDNVHGTNIASMATAALRERLRDPAVREAFPYVMIVTKPGARLDHKMMDGYIIPSDEALASSLLPPYGFGCDCIPVLISAEDAAARGLTGAHPAGDIYDFMKAQGATPRNYGGPLDFLTAGGIPFTAGPQSGFDSAFASTDMYSQLAALRQKAAEVQLEDPEAWAQLHLWLATLFAYDILRRDPPPQETPYEEIPQ